MKPLDLLDSASCLVSAHKGKPSQANLRRAVSSTYYAMFHHLSKTNADLLVGATKAIRSKGAWRQTYRALEHRIAKNACKDTPVLSLFPQAVADYAYTFATMQEKRHSADYDPYVKLTKSEVLADMGLVRQAVDAFDRVKVKDRRAFAAHVLFKKRP